MKKTKIKIFAMAMALVMVAVSSSLLTLAYLTSSTDTVTNTFTNSAKVKITLDEAKVDEYGVKIQELDGNNEMVDVARVLENRYKLIPGHSYVKDPTIHVEKGSEECWLFVKVTNPLTDIEDTTTIASQMSTNGWTVLSGSSDTYYYKSSVDAREEAKDVAVFEKLNIKSDADTGNSAYASAKIEIIAYAVQKDGFDSAQSAWNATFGVKGSTTTEDAAE